LALAFALNLAVARLGTAAALILSPRLIEAQAGWTTAVWAAALLMGIGLLFFVIYAIYDRKLTPPRPPQERLPEDERFSARDLKDLLSNRAFIVIALLCVTFYSAVFPFQAFCPDFLHHKFGLSLQSSGDLTSLIIWGTILFTPLFGLLVDKRGLRATLMIYGSSMLLLSHLALALTGLTPYVAMFVLGIAFSLVPAAMWPSVPLIVPEKRLGTAYGLMTSIQNLGLFAFPILAGWITDTVNKTTGAEAGGTLSTPLDYTYTILMFAALGIAGLLFAVLLRNEARRPGGPRLEYSSGSQVGDA
jgi:nitrate/nitrite transporter NarK